MCRSAWKRMNPIINYKLTISYVVCYLQLRPDNIEWVCTKKPCVTQNTNIEITHSSLLFRCLLVRYDMHGLYRYIATFLISVYNTIFEKTIAVFCSTLLYHLNTIVPDSYNYIFKHINQCDFYFPQTFDFLVKRRSEGLSFLSYLKWPGSFPKKVILSCDRLLGDLPLIMQ